MISKSTAAAAVAIATTKCINVERYGIHYK